MITSIKFLQANEVSEHAPKGPNYFHLGKVGQCWNFWIFGCSQCVPIKFSFCSHQILNKIPTCSSSSQFVPNSSLLCPIWFAQHCSLETYIAGPIFGHMFLCLEGILWESAELEFFFGDAHHQKRTTLWSPQLFNTNYTLIYDICICSQSGRCY